MRKKSRFRFFALVLVAIMVIQILPSLFDAVADAAETTTTSEDNSAQESQGTQISDSDQNYILGQTTETQELSELEDEVYEIDANMNEASEEVQLAAFTGVSLTDISGEPYSDNNMAAANSTFRIVFNFNLPVSNSENLIITIEMPDGIELDIAAGNMPSSYGTYYIDEVSGTLVITFTNQEVANITNDNLELTAHFTDDVLNYVDDDVLIVTFSDDGNTEISIPVDTASFEKEIVFDSQPRTLAEVQEAIDAYSNALIEAVYDTSAVSKPHWQFHVSKDIMPSGYKCVFISDDDSFKTTYWTFSPEVSLMSSGDWGSLSGADGSESNPYLIEDEVDLARLAEEVNAGNTYEDKYFKVTANINLSSLSSNSTYLAYATNWPGIGTYGANNPSSSAGAPFKGTFDGGGYTISGLQHTQIPTALTMYYAWGLFGYTDSATIKNINVIFFYTSSSNNGNSDVGGLVGSAVNGTTIDNCHVDGNSTTLRGYYLTTASGVGCYVGGLVGSTNRTSTTYENPSRVTITNCSAYNFNQITSDRTQLGGLIGYARNAEITDCEVYDLKHTSYGIYSAYGYVGGLIGQTSNVNVTDCEVRDITSGTRSIYAGGQYLGGLIGYADSGTITGNTVKNLKGIYGNSTDVGGLVGYANNTDVDSCTVSTLTSTTTQYCLRGTSYVGGLIGRVVSTNNNKVTNSTVSTIVEIYGSGSYVGGLIGNASGVSVDACNVSSISNQINTAGSYAGGLIAYVSDSSIENSNVTDVAQISGASSSTSNYAGGLIAYANNVNVSSSNVANIAQISGSDNVGGLIGYIEGNANTLENCTVKNFTSISGANYTGGLVGNARYVVINKCEVQNGLVTSSSTERGGMLGRAYRVNVTDSNAIDVAVGSTNYNYTGGFVGRIINGSGEIADTYSSSFTNCNVTGNTGNVTIKGANYVGGFAGSIDYSYTTFDNCHVMANNKFGISITLTGNHGGGFIGQVLNSAYVGVNDCNLTAEGSIAISGTYYLGGYLGKIQSTSSINTVAEFNNCNTTAGSNLAVTASGATSGGFIGYVNQYVTFTCDNCNVTTQSGSISVSGTQMTGGFIGYVYNNVSSTFRNCNVTAKGGDITVKSTSGQNSGGFMGYAFTNVSTIFEDCDVTSQDGNITVSSSSEKAGGFIGQALTNVSATFSDCDVSANMSSGTISVSSSYHTGGFLGLVNTSQSIAFTDCTVTGAYITAKTTTNNYVGGFAGCINSSGSIIMERCYINASYDIEVKSYSTYGGGFIGDIGAGASNQLKFIECYVTAGGTISVTTSGNYGGGFVGVVESGANPVFQSCFVTSKIAVKISGNDYMGGFAGQTNGTAQILDCYVESKDVSVSGVAQSGGFIGYAYADSILQNCDLSAYNSLTVTTTANYSGGFAGVVSSSTNVKDCNVTADTINVSGNAYVGGSVGANQGKTTIDNCHVSATTSITIYGKSNYVGGYLGVYQGQANVTRCSLTAPTIDVKGYSYTGGFVGADSRESAQANPTYSIIISDCYVKGNTISVESSGGSYAGGFSAASYNESEITNCYVEGTEITVKSSADRYTGGFVSVPYDYTKITNCYVKGETITVTTKTYYVGGFASSVYNYAKLTDCYVEGGDITVSTGNTSGGIYYGAGGFLAEIMNYATATNCYVKGNLDVTADLQYAGGFAGYIYGNATVTNCYASYGKATSKNHAGGFAGSIYGSAKVTNSYAHVDVYAKQDGTTAADIGGFVGTCYGNSEVLNCYSTGSVNANSLSASNTNARVGGFAGYLAGYAYVENTYSTGTVSSTTSTRVGGYVGFIESSNVKIYSSFYDTTTTRNNVADATGTSTNYTPVVNVTGISTTEMIQKSTFDTGFTTGIDENRFGAAGMSGSDSNPWYIDDDITYPYLYYQYDNYYKEGFPEDITNYYIANTQYTSTNPLGQKRADFLIKEAVPLSVITGGAELAYFPYSGDSMYDITSGNYEEVKGGSISDTTPWSLGGVSDSGIVAFAEGPYTSKTNDRDTLNEDGKTYVGDTVTYKVEIGNYTHKADFTDITMVDNLAEGVTFVDGSLTVTKYTKNVTDSNNILTENQLTLNIGNGTGTRPEYELVTDSNGTTSLYVYLDDLPKYDDAEDLLTYYVVTFQVYVTEDAAATFNDDGTYDKNIRNKGYVTGTLVYEDGTANQDVTLAIDDRDDRPVYRATVLDVLKTDEYGKALEGVQFELYYWISADNYGEPDNTNKMVVNTEVGGNIITKEAADAGGTGWVLYDTVTSGTDGYIHTKLIIYPAYYQLVETMRASNYYISPTSQWWIHVDGSAAAIDDYGTSYTDYSAVVSLEKVLESSNEFTLKNVEKKGSITITKQNNKDEVLPDVQFLVEKQSNDNYVSIYYHEDSGAWMELDEYRATIGDSEFDGSYSGYTDINGELVFSNLLNGSYRIIEVKTSSDEYQPLTEPIYFNIPYDVVVKPDGTVSDDNYDEELTTVDSDSGDTTYYYYKLKFTITNSTIWGLPEAGGGNLPVMLFIGASMIAASAAIYIFRRRKRMKGHSR